MAYLNKETGLMEPGSKDAEGGTGGDAGFGTPTAVVTKLAAGSEPTVSVSASGSNTAKVFNFAFGIPVGDPGKDGQPGSQGIRGSRMFAISSSPVSFSGTINGVTVFNRMDLAYASANVGADDKLQPGDTLVLSGYFHYPVIGMDSSWVYLGSRTSVQGPAGAAGAAAGFATPMAYIYSLPAGSEPTVSVSASGSNTAKLFTFNFYIPRGEPGDTAQFCTVNSVDAAAKTVSVTGADGAAYTLNYDKVEE